MYPPNIFGLNGLTTGLYQLLSRNLDENGREDDRSLKRKPSKSFDSPLSKKGKEDRNAIHSKIVQRILFQEDEAPNLQELSTTYERDFLHPPLHGNPCFQKESDLIIQIETLLPRCCSLDEIDQVRDGLRSLLTQQLDPFERLAEIGMLLYFLDRDRSMPDLHNHSLIDLRAEEIGTELSQLGLDHAHLQHPEKKQIPSGKAHYLLRSFARMVLTQDQKLNLGGVIALRFLLEKPFYTLSTSLTFEHRMHILLILDNLESMPQLKALLEAHASVHPELEDLIRIDLKLGKYERITSVEIIWDCLMALFFDVRQDFEPNCYAISALLHTSENATFQFVSKILEWLKEGHIHYFGFSHIPIYPLIERRLVYEYDLQITLPTRKALDLTPFVHIRDVFELANRHPEEREERTLQESLQSILSDSSQHISLEESQRHYFAFKNNALVHMMLSGMEFLSANFDLTNKKLATPSYDREKLFDSLCEDLRKYLNKCRVSEELQDSFIEPLWGKLFDQLCFEDRVEKDTSLDGESLNYGPSHAPKGIHTSPINLKKIEQLLNQESRRVVLLKDGVILPLDSITSLRDALLTMAREVVDEEGLHDSRIEEIISRRLNQAGWRKMVYDSCAEQFPKQGLKGAVFKQTDLLLFSSPGGNPDEVVRAVFEITLSSLKFIRPTEQGVLSAFGEWIRSEESQKIIQKERRILLSTRDHSFTSFPSRGIYFWDGEGNSGSTIRTKIIQPGQWLLQRKISEDDIDSLLIEVLKKFPAKRNSIIRAVSESKSKTYALCKSLLWLKFKNRNDQLKIKKIVQKFYDQINYNEEMVLQTFENLSIQFPDKRMQEGFLSTISQKFEGKRVYPFTLARTIMKMLIMKGFGTVDPFVIEAELCRTYSLPIPCYIGDLNWQESVEGSFIEKPPHHHLIARFDFFQNRVRFAERTLASETWAKDIPIRSFTSHY